MLLTSPLAWENVERAHWSLNGLKQTGQVFLRVHQSFEGSRQMYSVQQELYFILLHAQHEHVCVVPPAEPEWWRCSTPPARRTGSSTLWTDVWTGWDKVPQQLTTGTVRLQTPHPVSVCGVHCSFQHPSIHHFMEHILVYACPLYLVQRTCPILVFSQIGSSVFAATKWNCEVKLQVPSHWH